MGWEKISYRVAVENWLIIIYFDGLAVLLD
jgi:hypothetical protein